MRPLLLLALAWLSCLALVQAHASDEGSNGRVLLRQRNLRSAIPVERHAHGNIIEWEWIQSQGDESNKVTGSLALLLPANAERSPQMFTFDEAATGEEVLGSKELIAALFPSKRPVSCRLVVSGSSEESLPVNMPLGAALASHRQPGRNDASSLEESNALSLQCKSLSGLVRSFAFVHHVSQALNDANEVTAQKMLRQEMAAAGANAEQEYPFEAGEFLANNIKGLIGWASTWVKHHWGALRAFPDYTKRPSGQTGRWHLNTGAVLDGFVRPGAESESEVRIAMTADWGAGTLEADYVTKTMLLNSSGLPFHPHYTLHVGDIYYVGAPEEVQSNVLGIAPKGVKQGVTWPHGSIGSFAAQGNHEMYSRGYGFFDTFLPTLGVMQETGRMSGQAAGYVAMENAHWRVILLDTGYNTYATFSLHDDNNPQPDAVINWLINDVKIGNTSDYRGLIFFSHHQPVSAWEHAYPATPKQLAKLIPEGRQFLWFYGHEHRLALYDLRPLVDSTQSYYGRCIGNGGFPAGVSGLPPNARDSGLIAFDARQYKIETGFEDKRVVFNGFAQAIFKGPRVKFLYSTLASDPDTKLLSPSRSTLMAEEEFAVDGKGNVQLVSMKLNPNMTIIQHL